MALCSPHLPPNHLPLVASGAAWTALNLGSQLFLSPFTVMGFFLLFSSDSSCHNKLPVMLECKLLVQAESFNFEPWNGSAFPPKAGGEERRSQANTCQHVRLMLHSTEARHLLRMQVGDLTLRSQIILLSVGVKKH